MPTISGVTPQAFGDGTQVTVSGLGFGTSGTVTIGGLAQNIVSWSDSAVVFSAVRGNQSMGPALLDVSAGGGVEEWQLASGHWVPRKFNMDIAHPRPNAEMQTYAQAKNAYPGIAWDTRVLVYGGAYPFRYELVAAPTGMTIGETLVQSGDVLVEPANYGMLEWDNPTAGNHTITVRVYDQDYARGVSQSSYAEVTWTLTVGTSNWVFIDPVGGNNANAGTLAAPFRDTTPFISGSTYANKCVYVRAGTMNLVGMSGSHYTFDGSQPGVFVGYPAESAVINLDTGHFRMNAPDFCARNLELKHHSVGYGDSQKIAVCSNTGSHRPIMSDCLISNYNIGTATSGNGGVFVTLQSTPIDYPCFAYNELTGNMGPGWHSYEVNKAVIHGNRWHDGTLNGFDGSTHGLIFFKDSTKAASVRKNVAWESLGGTGGDRIFGFMGQNDGEQYGVEDLEWCYNTFAMTGYSGREATFREMNNDASHGDIDNYHFYRNSFKDLNNAEIAGQSVTNSTRTYNILHGGNAFDTDGGELTTSDLNNLESGSYLDADMKLTGASRTSYLGTHGAEVA